MWLATWDTRHYSFSALGATPAQARGAIKRGWQNHCTENPHADPKYYEEYKEDVVLTHMIAGIPYRDGESIRDPRKPEGY